jgi:hypothetical protein
MEKGKGTKFEHEILFFFFLIGKFEHEILKQKPPTFIYHKQKSKIKDQETASLPLSYDIYIYIKDILNLDISWHFQ